MKKITLILLILTLTFLVACQNTNTPRACTEEAKLCPDGTSVGRTGPDCEFAPCPATPGGEKVYCTEEQKRVQACTLEYAPVCGDDGVTYGNKCQACVEEGVGHYTVGECKEACAECPQLSPISPDFCKNGTIVSQGEDKCGCTLPPLCDNTPPGKKYVVQDAKQCKVVKFMCEAGMKPFFDEKGCGCEPETKEREYISTNTTVCAATDWICEEGMQQFFDEKGCGCEPGKATTPDGKLKAYDCTDPRPKACTKEYIPVCGQVQVQCIKAPCPPIKQTFGNKCEACANKLTISYTEGACTDSEAPTKTYCKPEQRGPVACTMDYNPVCAGNGKTYGNACGACSDPEVEYHTPGECN